MPLVRIALIKGKPQSYKVAIGDSIHRALMETISVPALDRFQLFSEHDRADLIYDPEYLGIKRSNGIVVIQITISSGRTLAQKRALFARIAELLRQQPGIRPEDVFINLLEVAKENWSFGNGEAQYAT
jgi:phenylpyruvate tautomerase PptA (4-oxalocrotonate tautomerase family)